MEDLNCMLFGLHTHYRGGNKHTITLNFIRLRAENSKAFTVSLAPGVVQTKMVLQVQRAHRYMVPMYVNLLTLRKPVDGAATSL